MKWNKELRHRPKVNEHTTMTTEALQGSLGKKVFAIKC